MSCSHDDGYASGVDLFAVWIIAAVGLVFLSDTVADRRQR